MTINKITDTPIAVNVYNQRSITANHAVCKNCVRQADGTLWALLGDHVNKLGLYKSADNGFSWSKIIDDVEPSLNLRGEDAFNVDGLFVHLVVDETWRNLDAYIGEWETIGDNGSVYRYRYDLDDILETPAGTQVLDTTDDNWQGGSFDITHNYEQVFLTWIKADGTLQSTRCSPRSTAVSSDLEEATVSGCYGLLSTVCDKDGNVHIANVSQEGTDRILKYIPYDSTTPSFGTPVEIENLGGTPAIAKDVAIALDGLGTLCVVYFDQGDAKVRYATSIDSGATWDVVSLTMTAGHATYNDKTSTDKAGRTNVMGGSQGGFLLTYVEDNSDGTPRAYIRELTTSDDGATYDLQAEKEVATDAPWTTEPIIGVQFFHPTDIKLLDISDPGLVRIAFTAGEGDKQDMADTEPVTIGQELLYASAYPTSLASEGTSHTLDTADSVSLRVLLDIHAGPNSLIDFYAAGMTGGFTERYITAFETIGTSIRFLQFEPKSSNFLADRSAYNAPVESEELVLFDPVTYSFPSPALTANVTAERTEIDVRKIHIPPTFFLSRTFLVNKGGYLKRTVWLCEFDGNQYELSQVIPRFINNQICYYEANAYVVGPSRNPFSRTILPSET